MGGGSGSRCQNGTTVSVKQGESGGGGSSGLLQGEVREMRLWEVQSKIRRKGIVAGKGT